jgi:hypothetical protein
MEGAQNGLLCQMVDHPMTVSKILFHCIGIPSESIYNVVYAYSCIEECDACKDANGMAL